MCVCIYQKTYMYFREQARLLFIEKISIDLFLLDSVFPIWEDAGL